MLNTKFTILFIVLLSLLSLPSHADIYKYVDKHGRVILTDKPRHSGYKRLVKTWKGWGEQKSLPKNFSWVKNQKKFDPTIRSIAKIYKLPHALVHAVIRAESSYNPDARSKAGAVGLMQLMPETAKQYGVKNRRSPRESIQAGSRHLRYLLKLFDNNLVLAIAAYNAGEGAVKKYGNKIPPYKETQNYVRKVIKYYKKYKVSMS
jgi:soluble lytic murein transglycosylase-like protein